MTESHEPEGTPQNSGDFKSLSHQALQTLLNAFPLIVRAAILPFAVSVAAVVVARWLGSAERYVFDVLHGLMVISYLTSLSRIVAGTFPGYNIMTFAVPRPSWPGMGIAKSIGGEALLVLLPTMFILYLLAINFGPFITAVGSTVLSVAAMLAVEYFLTTLLGLVVGAGMAKYTAENP
ncbi:MAG: hypothetical protein OQK24_04550 [Magnetovibrio sp.]|nr:hypothetical protein [Magnetovibrio sp.]